ncbi:MAG: hypothetical protein PHN80_06040 [Hespellia sp.]|nr:hypothetical protein [Hespellia sp.]
MIVIEKNEGTKIPFEVTGTKITFDDEIMLNLSKLQKDETEHKDICFDSEGDLVIGAESGRYYVAGIDIPAREYEAIESEAENEDGMGSGVSYEPKPLDMEKVTLTLWSIDDKTKVEQ